MRCVAFSAIVLLLIGLDRLSFNIGVFWRVVVRLTVSGLVAFPLVMLSGLIFSLVLRFRAFVRVFIGA